MICPADVGVGLARFVPVQRLRSVLALVVLMGAGMLRLCDATAAQPFIDPAVAETFGWACSIDDPTDCQFLIHGSDVSAGGETIVGTVFGPLLASDPFQFFHAFAWNPTAAGGPQAGLSYLPNPATPSGADLFGTFAYGINADGSTIAGSALYVPDSGGPSLGVFLPFVWRAAGGGQFGTPTDPLPGLCSAGPCPGVGGEALALSDSGDSVAGWSGGDGLAYFDGFGFVPFDPHAVLWTWNGSTFDIQQLDAGNLDGTLPIDPLISAAEGISGDGTTVVGWYSPLSPLEGTFGLSFDDYTPTDVFHGPINALPFVWTAANEMQTLPVDLAQFPAAAGFITPLEIGSGRAANADGSVVVGWSGFFDNSSLDPPVYEATRWTSADHWASAPGMGQVLGIVAPDPLPTTDPDFAISERLGSIANGVDPTGNLIVGEVDFLVGCGCTPFSEAVIWDAADGFAGKTLQQALQQKGVDLQGLYLTRANAVRVSATDDLHSDIIILGDAITSDNLDPIFMARLGIASGITTVDDQIKSFSNMASLLDQVTDDVGGPLHGLGDVVLHDLCVRPKEGRSAQPWCFFAFGTGTAYTDLTGSEFVGDVGLGHYFDPSNSVALSVGANHLDVHLDDGSASFEGTGYHIGGYVAHKPELGFQAFAAGTVGWWQDARYKPHLCQWHGQRDVGRLDRRYGLWPAWLGRLCDGAGAEDDGHALRAADLPRHPFRWLDRERRTFPCELWLDQRIVDRPSARRRFELSVGRIDQGVQLGRLGAPVVG